MHFILTEIKTHFQAWVNIGDKESGYDFLSKKIVHRKLVLPKSVTLTHPDHIPKSMSATVHILNMSAHYHILTQHICSSTRNTSAPSLKHAEIALQGEMRLTSGAIGMARENKHRGNPSFASQGNGRVLHYTQQTCLSPHFIGHITCDIAIPQSNVLHGGIQPLTFFTPTGKRR
jgi:hypothetical protein